MPKIRININAAFLNKDVLLTPRIVIFINFRYII